MRHHSVAWDQPCQVLLIEDDPGDARLIRELLRESGGAFVVEHADCLAAGLDHLRSDNVDVIALDMVLPDGQGLEAFRVVRAGARDVPIVVLSGLDDHHLAWQAVHEGAQDYVLKGHVTPEVLDRVLHYAIERAQLLAAERDARQSAEAAQRRLAFLSETSARVADSLDFQGTTQHTAEAMVPVLGDLCVVLLTHDSGATPRAAAVAHVDSSVAEQLRRVHARSPLRFDTSAALARTLASRKPTLVADIADEQLRPLLADATQRAFVRDLALNQAMYVPLLAHNERLLGALLLAFTGDRQFAPEDVALAEVAASRAALAIENARLFHDLEAAARTREAFFAAASHDLKNPLSAIKLWAERLRDLSTEPDPELLERAADRIDLLLDRSVDLIDELLDVARLHAGEPVPLRRSETDLVGLARRAIEEHGLRTDHELHLEAQTEAVVGFWDGPRLGRVLSNLLSNAIKYSPDGSLIRVRVSREIDAPHAVAVLQVVDQGIGIPPADLDSVFQRFHRAANAQGRAQGTGLGLWGARQIVERHGGAISASSGEGVGTTITVYLPCESSELASAFQGTGEQTAHKESSQE